MPIPNPLYPLIIEDYKHHLRAFPESYLSFRSFCQQYHVRLDSVRQWMRRHGIDVSTLYYEVLLERSVSDPSFELPPVFEVQKKHAPITSSTPTENVEPVDVMKGVSLTFPDGVIVNIRQASATALSQFIELYNNLSDQSYVQSE